MKLDFRISQNYLLAHAIKYNQLSDEQCRQDLNNLRNKAWEISKSHYNLFLGRFWHPNDHTDNIYHSLLNFVKQVKQTSEFSKILDQTRNYLEFVQKDWEENHQFCEKTLTDLTGFDFVNKRFTLYLTHPGLKNGKYLGNHTITFGHHEDWPHYSIVYCWHEILHAYLGKTELEHALIELLTDEELRVRLNGGKYPPFVGRNRLDPLKEKILPYWQEYLSQKGDKGVAELKKELITKYNLPESL